MNAFFNVLKGIRGKILAVVKIAEINVLINSDTSLITMYCAQGQKHHCKALVVEGKHLGEKYYVKCFLVTKGIAFSAIA